MFDNTKTNTTKKKKLWNRASHFRGTPPKHLHQPGRARAVDPSFDSVDPRRSISGVAPDAAMAWAAGKPMLLCGITCADEDADLSRAPVHPVHPVHPPEGIFSEKPREKRILRRNPEKNGFVSEKPALCEPNTMGWL